jgi:hypothetical protein
MLQNWLQRRTSGSKHRYIDISYFVYISGTHVPSKPVVSRLKQIRWRSELLHLPVPQVQDSIGKRYQ